MDSFIGQYFVAKLYCVTEGHRGFVALHRARRGAGGGWLVRSGQATDAAHFAFRYLEQREGRIHFAISAADDSGEFAGASLDVSHGGYLGLYRGVTSPAVWKFELVGGRTLGRAARFVLRDAQGRRTALNPIVEYTGSRGDAYSARGRRVDYLNTRSGAQVEFEARWVRALSPV